MTIQNLATICILIIVCLALLSVNTGPQSIPVIHSQATNSSFQEEVNTIANMPAQSQSG